LPLVNKKRSENKKNLKNAFFIKIVKTVKIVFYIYVLCISFPFLRNSSLQKSPFITAHFRSSLHILCFCASLHEYMLKQAQCSRAVEIND